jgi:uncharacterized BrkB/YihY/UPF0761 family membrane protein
MSEKVACEILKKGRRRFFFFLSTFFLLSFFLTLSVSFEVTQVAMSDIDTPLEPPLALLKSALVVAVVALNLLLGYIIRRTSQGSGASPSSSSAAESEASSKDGNCVLFVIGK